MLMVPVFAWFMEACNREREYTGMGSPMPLSAGRIMQWARWYGVHLRLDERRLFRDLDDVWLRVQNEMGGEPAASSGEDLGKKLDRIFDAFG